MEQFNPKQEPVVPEEKPYDAGPVNNEKIRNSKLLKAGLMALGLNTLAGTVEGAVDALDGDAAKTERAAEQAGGFTRPGAILEAPEGTAVFGEDAPAQDPAKKSPGSFLESGNGARSISLLGAFESGAAAIDPEKREALAGKIAELFSEAKMSREAFVKFATDANSFVKIRASSDETPFRGSVAGNKELTEARIASADALWKAVANSIERSDLTAEENAAARRFLSSKAVEYDMPPGAVLTDADVLKRFPELRGASTETIREKARNMSISFGHLDNADVDKEIVEKLGEYDTVTLLVDGSGSMKPKLERLRDALAEAPEGYTLVVKRFLTGIEGEPRVIKSADDFTRFIDELEERIPKAPDGSFLDVQEEAPKSLYDELALQADAEGKRAVELLTDEYLRNVTPDIIKKCVSLAEEKGLDVKLKIFDAKGGSFRTVTLGQVRDAVARSFPDARPGDLFGFNVYNGGVKVDTMANIEQMIAANRGGR